MSRSKSIVLPPAGCTGLLLILCQIRHDVVMSIFLCVHPSIRPEEEKKKKVVRLPVQRSVETGLAIEFKARFTRQPSRDPDAEDPKPGAYVAPFFSSCSLAPRSLSPLFCISFTGRVTPLHHFLSLQAHISWCEVGVGQTVHRLPGWIRPCPAGWTANSSHSPHG